MSVIPFKSEAGKTRAFCPGCGKPRKIIDRVDVSQANEHFNYESEGVTINCPTCGRHQLMRIVEAE
jgi:predicted RNA-binding Zn-ribbon protein involved in translation (DUF1610 family)